MVDNLKEHSSKKGDASLISLDASIGELNAVLMNEMNAIIEDDEEPEKP